MIDSYALALYTLQQSIEFRTTTGLPVASEKPDFKTHKAVILEELKEAADGLTDSIVTISGLLVDYPLSGAAHSKEVALKHIQGLIEAMQDIGFDPYACVDKVQAANMSKVCTADNVEKTEEKYSALGVKTFRRELSSGFFGVFCAEDVTGVDGKFYPANKLLKSIDWFEPNWSNYREWLTDDMLDLIHALDDNS